MRAKYLIVFLRYRRVPLAEMVADLQRWLLELWRAASDRQEVRALTLALILMTNPNNHHQYSSYVPSKNWWG